VLSGWDDSAHIPSSAIESCYVVLPFAAFTARCGTAFDALLLSYFAAVLLSLFTAVRLTSHCCASYVSLLASVLLLL